MTTPHVSMRIVLSVYSLLTGGSARSFHAQIRQVGRVTLLTSRWVGPSDAIGLILAVLLI